MATHKIAFCLINRPFQLWFANEELASELAYHGWISKGKRDEA
jgi:hypothetical protein